MPATTQRTVRGMASAAGPSQGSITAFEYSYIARQALGHVLVDIRPGLGHQHGSWPWVLCDPARTITSNTESSAARVGRTLRHDRLDVLGQRRRR